MQGKSRLVWLLALSFYGILLGCDAHESEKQSLALHRPGPQAEPVPVESVAQLNRSIASTRENAITQAVKTCSSAVVGINVTEVREVDAFPFGGLGGFGFDPFFDQYFSRFRQKQVVRGLGSGFIISPDGYVLTNDHVAGTASKVVVTMTNGEKYDAEIIGTDKTSDVALLKIKADNLPFLKLSNSDDLIVGEWAIAFGNPFGLFDINAKPTVTVGVISNTGVSFLQDDRVYKNMIQTDAAISSGNSGGPLVNARGEVIGMNTVIYSTSQNSRGAGSIGIGFSVPINRVKQIMELLKKGKIDRDFFPGLGVQQIDDNIARYFKLSKKEGVAVVEVVRNSSADKAGIEPGDVIVEVEGVKVSRDEEVIMALRDAVAGQKIQLTILQGDERIIKTMKLEKYRR